MNINEKYSFAELFTDNDSYARGGRLSKKGTLSRKMSYRVKVSRWKDANKYKTYNLILFKDNTSWIGFDYDEESTKRIKKIKIGDTIRIQPYYMYTITIQAVPFSENDENWEKGMMSANVFSFVLNEISKIKDKKINGWKMLTNSYEDVKWEKNGAIVSAIPFYDNVIYNKNKIAIDIKDTGENQIEIYKSTRKNSVNETNIEFKRNYYQLISTGEMSVKEFISIYYDIMRKELAYIEKTIETESAKQLDEEKEEEEKQKEKLPYSASIFLEGYEIDTSTVDTLEDAKNELKEMKGKIEYSIIRGTQMSGKSAGVIEENN